MYYIRKRDEERKKWEKNLFRFDNPRVKLYVKWINCGSVGSFWAVLLEQESVVKFLCEKLGFWRVCKVFY